MGKDLEKKLVDVYETEARKHGFDPNDPNYKVQAIIQGGRAIGYQYSPRDPDNTAFTYESVESELKGVAAVEWSIEESKKPQKPPEQKKGGILGALGSVFSKKGQTIDLGTYTYTDNRGPAGEFDPKKIIEMSQETLNNLTPEQKRILAEFIQGQKDDAKRSIAFQKFSERLQESIWNQPGQTNPNGTPKEHHNITRTGGLFRDANGAVNVESDEVAAEVSRILKIMGDRPMGPDGINGIVKTARENVANQHALPPPKRNSVYRP